MKTVTVTFTIAAEDEFVKDFAETVFKEYCSGDVVMISNPQIVDQTHPDDCLFCESGEPMIHTYEPGGLETS